MAVLEHLVCEENLDLLVLMGLLANLVQKELLDIKDHLVWLVSLV